MSLTSRSHLSPRPMFRMVPSHMVLKVRRKSRRKMSDPEKASWEKDSLVRALVNKGVKKWVVGAILDSGAE